MNDDGDVARLSTIVELGDKVLAQIGRLTFEAFGADDREVDSLAFRMGHIGEATKKLSEDLKFRHPEINWPAILGFRNIMFHDYLGISQRAIWDSATHSLPALIAVARVEMSAGQ